MERYLTPDASDTFLTFILLLLKWLKSKSILCNMDHRATTLR